MRKKDPSLATGGEAGLPLSRKERDQGRHGEGNRRETPSGQGEPCFHIGCKGMSSATRQHDVSLVWSCNPSRGCLATALVSLHAVMLPHPPPCLIASPLAGHEGRGLPPRAVQQRRHPATHSGEPRPTGHVQGARLRQLQPSHASTCVRSYDSSPAASCRTRAHLFPSRVTFCGAENGWPADWKNRWLLFVGQLANEPRT